MATTIPLEDRLYLDVPRAEKDKAKRVGARWDRDKVAWYIPKSADKAAFKRWLSVPMPPRKEERYYLTIPYDLRHIAKSGGAKWDKERKLWYATQDSDLGFLEEWLPEGYRAELDTVHGSRNEFADALRAIGFILEEPHPVADEQPYRVKTEGDKGLDASGYYRWFHNDGIPGGYAMNNRTREEVKWSAKRAFNHSKKQRRTLVTQIAAKRERVKREQEEKQIAAAVRVNAKLGMLQPVSTPTPYLIKKNITPTQDIYTDGEGATTCIPHYDLEGEVWCLTYIFPDGSKKYTRDGKKSGCFHVVNGFTRLEALEVLVITEGYSTAATLAEALGFSTVAAFDNGNLLPVAQQLRDRYPGKPIVIAGDDDRYVCTLYGRNPGREQAEKAARMVGGKAVFPVFTPEEMEEDSKRFTDFNDLCNVSQAGREEFLRQVQDMLISPAS